MIINGVQAHRGIYLQFLDMQDLQVLRLGFACCGAAAHALPVDQ